MGASRTFIGNYSDYVIAKAASVEAQLAAWEKQQKEIEQTKDLIGRSWKNFRTRKQIGKPFIRKQMKIRFPDGGRSGRSVVVIKGKRRLIWIKQCSKLQLKFLRTGNLMTKCLLGRCNFKADMLDRRVLFLSGGEKAVLAFCKFMVKPSTLLVLDEPTNHLDVPIILEMLEKAINEYQGTVIMVSYDRYFIKQIVNRVLEVKDGTMQRTTIIIWRRILKQEIDEKLAKAKAKSKRSKAEREARKKQKM